MLSRMFAVATSGASLCSGLSCLPASRPKQPLIFREKASRLRQPWSPRLFFDRWPFSLEYLSQSRLGVWWLCGLPCPQKVASTKTNLVTRINECIHIKGFTFIFQRCIALTEMPMNANFKFVDNSVIEKCLCKFIVLFHLIFYAFLYCASTY